MAIFVGITEYSPEKKNIQDLMKQVENTIAQMAAKKGWNATDVTEKTKSAKKSVGARFKEKAVRQFDNYEKLVDALLGELNVDSLKKIGADIRGHGSTQEELAAKFISGHTSRDRLVDWARGHISNEKAYEKTGKASQDPTLYTKDKEVGLQPDIWSDKAVGVVGPPSKANNLSRYNQIMGDLSRIASDHKVAAYSFIHRGGKYEDEHRENVVKLIDATKKHANITMVIINGNGDWVVASNDADTLKAQLK
ncbi:hypothetical protein ACFXOM_23155 [Streptomyces sp. NPDC059169]|uniref:hypothetical protein n=1 Tax=Streptomyces sp. NPDC059169 TaxID=3346754 RepID=UPI0036D1AAA3